MSSGTTPPKRKRTGQAVWNKPYKWQRDAWLAQVPARSMPSP